MKSQLILNDNKSTLEVSGRHFNFIWSKATGLLESISLFDGLNWNEILASGQGVGTTFGLPLASFEITEHSAELLKFLTVHKSSAISVTNKYEVFPRGYVIGNMTIEATEDEAVIPADAYIGMALDEKVVFGNNFEIKWPGNELDNPFNTRGLSVNFSTDNREVTNSITLMLEYQTQNLCGLPCKKIVEEHDGYRFVGWDLGRSHPKPIGFEYTNRWCLAVTAPDNSPNPVRSQRIYHWYGAHPDLPTDDVLIEMAEYGCSILALHNPSTYISGGEINDPDRAKAVVELAHKLGMKVLFYCQPLLMSIEHPQHGEFLDARTDWLRIWHSMADTQIVHYTKDSRWDCDELCLRSEKAFEFMFNSAIRTWKEYGSDGLYIDFGWPAQGLCNDTRHGHKPGMFNFYDYLRMIREWRKTIGEDQIMIGHGGGFLIGSDFVEAFDACLTGEAQGELSPSVIGQHFGPAPTLWAMHRRKQDDFRSDKTIEQCIRQGMTPHCGVGIMGTSVLASLDPAHHPALIALWQIWRSFPVHKATFYNYLTEQVIELDNNECYYSLYVTPEQEVLLLLVNAGGEKTDSRPAVGVNAKLNLDKLKLPEQMRCWRMKGNTYETFRITEVEALENGYITVPEIGKHEFTAFLLSPDTPPAELTNLVEHLEGRWDRLPNIMQNKQKRLAEFDRLIDKFAKEPTASTKMDYNDFMKGRVAE